MLCVSPFRSLQRFESGGNSEWLGQVLSRISIVSFGNCIRDMAIAISISNMGSAPLSIRKDTTTGGGAVMPLSLRCENPFFWWNNLTIIEESDSSHFHILLWFPQDKAEPQGHSTDCCGPRSLFLLDSEKPRRTVVGGKRKRPGCLFYWFSMWEVNAGWDFLPRSLGEMTFYCEVSPRGIQISSFLSFLGLSAEDRLIS